MDGRGLIIQVDGKDYYYTKVEANSTFEHLDVQMGNDNRDEYLLLVGYRYVRWGHLSITKQEAVAIHGSLGRLIANPTLSIAMG